MEVIYIGKFKPIAILECSIASFVAYYTAVILGAKHTHFTSQLEFTLDPRLVISVLIAAISFGLAARFFIFTTHVVEKILAKKIKSKPWQAFTVGALLVVLFSAEGSFRFNGLSLDLVLSSFQSPSSLEVPFLKSIFTSLTVGSGFKGGEFIPLVLIGASLGSFIAGVLGTSVSLFAGLGFVSVFGAAAKTPITCTVMAMELFGYQIGPWALISCMISYFIAGQKGIYKNQK
jgi:H+/Cl- antiporter ClcA